MTRLSLPLVAALALVSASPALATNGMRMIGFGATQVAMGGASVAQPLDAASVITNPAGMAALGRRVDFGASYFRPYVSYNAKEIPNLPVPGMAVESTQSFDSQRGASPVPALGLILPIDDRLSFGIGAYGIAGMGVDFPENLYRGVTYSSYSQMRFAPGVAYRVSDQLSLGLTVNAMYATMAYDAAEGLLQVSHQAASSFGIGATVGVTFRPTKCLAFGAAYETKSWFEDFKFNVKAHQPLDPNTGAPAVDGSGNPVILPASVDSVKFNQPSSATFGVALGSSDRLLLVGDVQWIHWSESNGQNLPQYTSDVAKTGAMPWNLNWNDQWVFKLGAQYRPTPRVALRAGYNYGRMPLDSTRAFENIAFPAVVQHHVTAGLGFDVTERFGVNLAAMYAPESKITGSNPQQQYIASYTAKMSQLALDMAIAYRL